MISGIDVSHHRALVDWPRVKASGVQFAYARSTIGLDTDREWANNLHNAPSVIPFGAFHYLYSNVDPIAQAKHFHRLTPKLAIPPWLDIEGPGHRLSNIERWLLEYKNLSGQEIIIYTRATIWDPLARAEPEVSRRIAAMCKLAVAHYGPATPTLPFDWREWTFWQFSETGTVPGVRPPTDLDWYNGTLAELLEEVPMDIQRMRELTAEIRSAAATLQEILDMEEEPIPQPQPLWRGRTIGALAVRGKDGQAMADPKTGLTMLLANTEVEVWGETIIQLPNNGGSSARYYIGPERNANVWKDRVVRFGTGGGGDFEIVWPVDSRGINQYFGDNPPAYKPFNLDGHDGVDLFGKRGDSVRAGASGIVSAVITPVQDFPAGHAYGIHVRIKHLFGPVVYTTVYAHLLTTSLIVGKVVAEGDVIGQLDNTGNSSNDHLHLGLYMETLDGVRLNRDNGFQGYLNPLPFLRFPNV